VPQYAPTTAAQQPEVFPPRPGSVPSGQPLLLLLPDDWAGRMVAVQVAGVDGGKQQAQGSATVATSPAETATVTITLHGTAPPAAPPSAPSTPATPSTPSTPPAPAPTCTDRCAPGQRQCTTGGNGVRTCQRASASQCWDWGPTAACPQGMACVPVLNSCFPD
jgi:hypothetical protein